MCRSFIFAYLTRGRPIPLHIVLYATIFCSLNGFLQGHHLLHCAPQSTHTWLTGPRRAAGVYGPLVQSNLWFQPSNFSSSSGFRFVPLAGFLLFVLGMIINIHSDHILRNLRKPGEMTYRIPQGTTANNAQLPRQWLPCPPWYLPSLCHLGGMFCFVSGANFFGEIVEWCGFALAAWSLPAFAFAFFTTCSIGPRACHHHR